MNSAGIQTLLDSEKEAQKIVQKGQSPAPPIIAVNYSLPQLENVWRQPDQPFGSALTVADRTKKVKDAKSEAQKEIDEYRKKKEEEYKKFESEQSSGNKKAEDDANKDADAKLKEIQEAGKKSGDKVVADLIKVVTTPRPEVPDKVSKDS